MHILETKSIFGMPIESCVYNALIYVNISLHILLTVPKCCKKKLNNGIKYLETLINKQFKGLGHNERAPE